MGDEVSRAVEHARSKAIDWPTLSAVSASAARQERVRTRLDGSVLVGEGGSLADVGLALGSAPWLGM